MSNVPLPEPDTPPAARDCLLHPETTADAPVGMRRALIIGCNGPPTLPNPLRYAAKDAHDLAATLTQVGWTIDAPLLVNEQATSTAIFDRLAELSERCGAQDELLIYFAGHGVRLPVPQRPTDEVFLVTHDFNPVRIRTKPDSLLGLSWLRSAIEEQLPAAKVLLILDCCYAGNYATVRDAYHAFFDLLATLVRQPAPRATPRDALRSVVAATGEDAAAFEQHGNGRLTRLLLDALAGNHDDLFDAQGNLTLDRLVPYLRQGLAGTQQLSTHRVESAEFVLCHRPDRTRAALIAQRKQAGTTQRRVELQAMVDASSEIMEDRLREFVGRVTELREIRDRIAALLPSGGYLTITAPAGQGKSSVIARLVEDAAPSQPPFHFIPLDPGPDFQVPLLRNLMARLILKHDLSDLYVAIARRSVLSDEFKRLLREVHANGRQEVIYIDGLDQFAREADGARDLSFLPEAPPPGIVFVLGTRPDDTLRPLQLRDPHQTFELGPLSTEDFTALLHKRGIALDRAVIERLYHALERNALFLTLAVRELEMDRALSPDALLRRIADDPKRLFSLAIERLEKCRTDWSTIRLALGFLVTAGEPLSRPMIGALVSRASRLVFDRDIRNALDALGGFLIRDSSAHYSLFHAKFRDYLGQQPDQPSAEEHLFSPDEIAWFHTQFAAWCGQGANDVIWESTRPGVEQQRRAYARRHYITHLYGSGDDPRLWQVLDDGHYGRRKLADDPSTYAYARDLNLGRQSAARPDLSVDEARRRLPHLWRYTLLRGSLASRADRYPAPLFSALVLLGREAEAIGLAELINNRWKQVHILTTIAQRLAEHNRRAEGATVLRRAEWLAHDARDGQALHTVMSSLLWFECFAEARAAADAIADERARAWALAALAQGLATAQHPQAAPTFAEARTVADAITDDEGRARALAALTEALATAHRFAEARTVADAIPSDWVRAKALTDLTEALATAQHFAEARTVADAIPFDWIRAKALATVAQALTAAQHPQAAPTFAEARTVADAIPDNWARTTALAALAQALAAAQHPQAAPTFVEARTVADAIADDWTRAKALTDLAQVLTTAHRFAEARAATDAIPSDEARNWALTDLAQALTTAHRFAEARAAADAIADDEARARAITALAQALTAAQRFAEARTAADAIPSDEARTTALADLAQALAAAQHPQAAQRFAEARTAANALPSDEARNWALTDLAQALTTAHRFAEARAAADAIADDEARARALAALAQALAAAQHPQAAPTFAEARTVADAIPHDWARDWTLAALAQTLVAVQRFAEARTVADAIRRDRDRADALTALTQALTTAQRFAEARTVADAIPFDEARARALAALAQALAAVQRFAEARTVADAIPSDEARARALAALAQALATAQHPQAEPTFVEARTVADAIPSDWTRADALAALAQALAAAQHPQAELTFAEARAAADAIAYDEARARALAALAQALTAAHRFAEARTVADAIPSDWVRADALAALAQTLATAQRFTEARTVANAIPSDEARARALAALAQALATAQRFTEARAAADAIADDEARARALAALAQALTAAQHLEATPTFAEARTVADAIPSDWVRADALTALAQALATTGNESAVLDLAQRAWLLAMTRDEALRLMPVVVPLVRHDPDLALQLIDGITWVDRFLRGEGSR